MASAYPGGLDSFATNKADGTATPTDHPTHHNDLADAVNKIEAELGVNPSGGSATVAAAIAAASVPEAVMYPYGYVAGETPHASDDFFAAYSGYTEVAPSGTVVWGASRGGLGVKWHGVGASNVAATLKAKPAAGLPITIETRIRSVHRTEANNGLGLCFTNGTATTSTMIGFGWLSGASLNAWSTPSGPMNALAGSGLSALGNTVLEDAYIRLIWSAANTFEFAVSPDGEQWVDYGFTATNVTLAPTHIGFWVTNWVAGTNTQAAVFNYLRVYEADLSV